MEKTRYVIGVLIVTMMPPGLLWWFLVHPFIGFWRRVGARATLTVMATLGVGGMIALATVRDDLLGRDLGTHGALVVVAAALLVVAIRIALARRRHLTRRILAGIPELEQEGEASRLLTEGIYARVRHPRYLEVAIGTLAYASFANYLGSWVVAAVTLPTLHLIVLLEERELADRFGPAWEAYRTRVPRYWPRRS